MKSAEEAEVQSLTNNSLECYSRIMKKMLRSHPNLWVSSSPSLARRLMRGGFSCTIQLVWILQLTRAERTVSRTTMGE
jgi:hypothetical protein